MQRQTDGEVTEMATMKQLWKSRAGTPHVRLGVIGTGVLGVVLILALSGNVVASLLGERTYSAAFAEAGGLLSGDNVVVSGMPVGKVRSVDLVDDHVRVTFALSNDAVHLGDRTRAVIMAQTALGKKALQLQSLGSTALEEDAEIPLERTRAPFDVTQALSNLSQTLTDLDEQRLGDAVAVNGEFLAAVSDDLRPALDGIHRLSRAIASRDAELARLLDHSAGVTEVLAERDKEIGKLFADGGLLLNALNDRANAIEQLLVNATAVSRQVKGVVKDNESQIGPALDQLDGVLRVLRANKANIDHALGSAAPLVRELGEVVAAFPGFNVYVPNITMTDKVPALPDLMTGGAK